MSYTYIDNSPAWSPDGQWIAFHRLFSSSMGPPGVYVIHRTGGQARFICQGDALGPTDLRFSPDGTRLVGEWGLRVGLIDIPTGQILFPFYTDNGAVDPDWAPDGQSIVYVRPFLRGYPPEAPESTGIHRYNVNTGEDWPIKHNGDVLVGSSPRWSREGDLIAYVAPGQGGNGSRIAVVDSSGFNHRFVVQSPEGVAFSHVQWLYLKGERQLLFDYDQTPRSTHVTSIDADTYHQWPITYSPWDTVSPLGDYVVYARAQPGDSVAVLFVAQTTDFTLLTMRQLTSYEAGSIPVAQR